MANLATIEDLEPRLGRDVTDRIRADQLLSDASAAVRSYTGQSFTLETTTVRLVPKRGWVRLPQRPVTSVTAVADVNENELTFEWVHGERVQVQPNLDGFSFVPWADGIKAVDVTYTHGYTSVPDDIVMVVCQIAGRALGSTPDASALQSEAIGDYSYSTGAAASQGAAGILAGERAILDRYRRQARSVSVTA